MECARVGTVVMGLVRAVFETAWFPPLFFLHFYITLPMLSRFCQFQVGASLAIQCCWNYSMTADMTQLFLILQVIRPCALLYCDNVVPTNDDFKALLSNIWKFYVIYWNLLGPVAPQHVLMSCHWVMYNLVCIKYL